MLAVRRRVADILFLFQPMFCLRRNHGYRNSLSHLKPLPWQWYTEGKRETRTQSIPSKKIFGGFFARLLSILKVRFFAQATRRPQLERVAGKKKDLRNIFWDLKITIGRAKGRGGV